MEELLNTAYLWVKAIHVISMICWMAALLYLPRLFVYHCEAVPMTEFSEKLKVMEYRLSRYIMTPSMLMVFGTGLLLVMTPGLVVWSFGWIHIKLFFVLLLSATHGFFVRCVKVFAADNNQYSQKFFRVVNEVPTLLMIGIVIMVIVKPF